MVRYVDKESRNRGVLEAVVESYIKNSCAVSSEELCQAFDCSSATMRNVMTELEAQGYLAHMHTSSGRVPTDKGYRYYVDILLTQMQLVEDEKEQLTREYNRQLDKLEDILEKTTEVLSAFTHCTGIVSLAAKGNTKIFYSGASFIAEHPELKHIEKIRNILRILDEKKKLLEILNRDLEKKLNVYIGRELAVEEISSCSLIVSAYNMEDRPSGRVAVLGPRSMNYSYVIPTIEYVSELMSRALEGL
jgi:heat-inducible transcriptional repressor